jgi:F-type H+-transporting ATPase subunit b
LSSSIDPQGVDVLTAVVIQASGSVRVELFSAGGEEKLVDPSECLFEPEIPVAAGEKIPQSECGPGPSPILPEAKEFIWGASSFVVFALLMRFFLFPRLKKGMDARYNSIREGHENADAARSAARSEVAQYEAAVASAKADAAKVVDAARATLESERQAAISAANDRINAKREAALREADAAKAAVRGQIESAVGDVVSSAVEAATGKRPDSAAVSRAVADVMSAGVR